MVKKWIVKVGLTLKYLQKFTFGICIFKIRTDFFVNNTILACLEYDKSTFAL